MADQDPMNILLITSDQQRLDTLGVLNPQIQTPNLDRLAARGILFERAYTVNPVCTPSRCTILTGQYPSRHGCFHVGTRLPEDYAPLLSRQLADAGYFTALLGKAHFQPCLDPDSFEAEPHVHALDFFRNWSGPYYGFQHARLVIGHTAESHAGGMHYGAWLEDQGVNLEDYFGIYPYTHFGAWSLPEIFHGSRWVADETLAAMDLARAADQPFFLWASFQDPHNPYVTPEPWASMYEPGTMSTPLMWLEDLDSKPPFYNALQFGDFYGDDPDLSPRGWGDCRLQEEMTAGDMLHLRAAYFGMVSLMDHHIGRILDGLAARGLLDKTLIIFTTDHGDYLGDHFLWGKGLPAYEAVQNIPFIVADPRCVTPGCPSDALQSLVDIAPTVLDAAGLTPPPDNQGINQARAWQDSRAAARREALVEFRPSQGPFMQHTLITMQYKLVHYRRRDYGELYDLQRDPYQLQNLYDDPAFLGVRRKLEARLALYDHEEDEIVRERTAPA